MANATRNAINDLLKHDGDRIRREPYLFAERDPRWVLCPNRRDDPES